MTELKEAWAKLWDFAHNTYNDEPSGTGVEIEAACMEYNRQQPFRLDDVTALTCIDESISYQKLWEFVSGWYEFTTEPKPYNHLNDSIISFNDFAAVERPKPPSFMDIFLGMGS